MRACLFFNWRRISYQENKLPTGLHSKPAYTAVRSCTQFAVWWRAVSLERRLGKEPCCWCSPVCPLFATTYVVFVFCWNIPRGVVEGGGLLVWRSEEKRTSLFCNKVSFNTAPPSLYFYISLYHIFSAVYSYTRIYACIPAFSLPPSLSHLPTPSLSPSHLFHPCLLAQ